jgi:hypothetical protein
LPSTSVAPAQTATAKSASEAWLGGTLAACQTMTTAWANAPMAAWQFDKARY